MSEIAFYINKWGRHPYYRWEYEDLNTFIQIYGNMKLIRKRDVYSHIIENILSSNSHLSREEIFIIKGFKEMIEVEIDRRKNNGTF